MELEGGPPTTIKNRANSPNLRYSLRLLRYQSFCFASVVVFVVAAAAAAVVVALVVVVEMLAAAFVRNIHSLTHTHTHTYVPLSLSLSVPAKINKKKRLQ